MARRFSFTVDRYSLALIGAVAIATIAPVYGDGAKLLSAVTTGAITLLFFLHGAKLSRGTILAGATHWRLYCVVLACTFVLFPLLGFLLLPLASQLLSPLLVTGFLYLTLLPSTVQSSIAFTSIARGNITAAVCSAAASNLIGTILTPLLVALLIGTKMDGAGSGARISAILMQLFVPFLAGQAVQPWLGPLLSRYKNLVTTVDRGSILLVVYGAFSAAVVEGLFRKFSIEDVVALVFICCTLLAAVMCLSFYMATRFGFSREDQIVILFCGSKKSLASGVPMAGVIFPTAAVGTVILPLMIFHQIQLLVCAYVAERYARGANRMDSRDRGSLECGETG